jgi:hypothetical protein
MWLASKRGTAAADESEAAQEHSTGASSAESAAEGHGLGISDSSASEDMLRSAPTRTQTGAMARIQQTQSRRQKGQTTRPATSTWPNTSQERLCAHSSISASENSMRIHPSKERRHEHTPAWIRATLTRQGSVRRLARQCERAPRLPVTRPHHGGLQVSYAPTSPGKRHAREGCSSTQASTSGDSNVRGAHAGNWYPPYTELTQAADTMLRFVRRHCLKSQHRKEDRCTGNAKKLIRQLTAAMKSEHERAQDQLVMEMHSEQAAQHTKEVTGTWDYTPCYLVKHVDGVKVHTLTCANAGCNKSRRSQPCPKYPSGNRLFCSRVCKDEVCVATGLRVRELRWVHDHHHSREDDLVPGEPARQGQRVEHVGDASPSN